MVFGEHNLPWKRGFTDELNPAKVTVMRCMANPIVTLLLFLLATASGQATHSSTEEVRHRIDSGEWKDAIQFIDSQLQQTNLPWIERDALLWEKEKMRRIRLDFTQTREQVFKDLAQVIPGLGSKLFEEWEQAHVVEYMDIDGVRWYFCNAVPNVPRISPQAQKLVPANRRTLDAVPYETSHLRQVIRDMGQGRTVQRRFRITYTLSVKPDAVPAGETVRAWLPFPQRGGRQSQVSLISCAPPQHILSPEGYPLSSIYLEKTATGSTSTVFQVVFEYTARADYRVIDPDRVSLNGPLPPEVQAQIKERPDHLAFTDDLRRLASEIVGHETNAFRKARLLYQWVDENMPWASAREYSTLDSLPAYALKEHHGDCGIQTMLFMAMCRIQGIPARWESGWITGCVKSMHDWCTVYLPPYGWVPMDVSYGQVPVSREAVHWFYCGGIDAYRLVVNTDYGQAPYPSKIHPRSEPVDFQRGEVEWRGGNLYYDSWRYDFQVKILDDGASTRSNPTSKP